ncbi:growth/differentiation factor 2 [Stigmatopora argus]
MNHCGSFFLQLCVSLLLSAGRCACKPIGKEMRAEGGRGVPYSPPALPVEDDEDSGGMAHLLGSMKEDFLRKLNLSEVPREKGKVDPPQFMMELYNKYASDSTAVPQSDVIRSFGVQDISRSLTDGAKSRMLFNLSLPSHEKVIKVQLHLFVLPDAGAKATSRPRATHIEVYGPDYDGAASGEWLLAWKEWTDSPNRWVTLDVTAAVRDGPASRRATTGFDVAVVGRGARVSLSVGGNTSAALLVFSDDLGSRRREAGKELREMIFHQEESFFHLEAGHDPEEPLPSARHPRKRRKAEREYCRRTSLKVNFRDIGWDSWIVAPPEYDAFECRGLCYHPLTDESTPSKHALIQTLMNIRNPKKTNMACCVPIKLDPITIMYQENGRVTIRYLYEEMKVAECGCR